MTRLVARVLVVLAIVTSVGVSDGSPAGAAVTDGVTVASVPVNGVYTPIVGNFVGSSVGIQYDEIIWFRPGTGFDTMWSPGSNGFVDRTTYPVDIDLTLEPMVADFDKDRLDDILWVNQSGLDQVWYAEGDGTFDVRTWDIPDGSQVIVGDFLRTNDEVFGQREVFFYRPGPASDGLIRTNTDRSAPSIWPFPVNGTYQPFVMRNASNPPSPTPSTGTPGSAQDWSWQFTDCAGTPCRNVNEPFAVSGTYTPIVDTIGRCGPETNCSNGILWYKPGPGKDYFWAGWKAGESPITYNDVNVAGTYQPVRAGDRAIVWYSPTGADYLWRWNFSNYGYETGGYPVALGSGLVPIVGAFKTSTLDRADVFWYGPGSRPDTQVLTVGQLG